MSKFIKLKNDFGINRAVDKNSHPDNEITASWIRAAIVSGYAGGLTHDKRRIYATLDDRLEKAVLGNYDYFEVNPVEYAFIVSAFKSAVIDPKFTHTVIITEDAVLNALDVEPEPTATPETPPVETPKTEEPTEEKTLEDNTAKAE